MKKILKFAALGAAVLALFGCTRKEYSVDYSGEKEKYDFAQDTYKAGEKVKLCYPMMKEEMEYFFYVDDELIDYTIEGDTIVISFTMPSHDITIRSLVTGVMTPSCEIVLDNNFKCLTSSDVYMTADRYISGEFEYTIVNNSEEAIFYGEDFSLMKRDGDDFMPMEPEEGELAFIMIAYSLEPGQSVTKTADLSVYGKLPAGDYRFTKSGGLRVDFRLYEEWTE